MRRISIFIGIFAVFCIGFAGAINVVNQPVCYGSVSDPNDASNKSGYVLQSNRSMCKGIKSNEKCYCVNFNPPCGDYISKQGAGAKIKSIAQLANAYNKDAKNTKKLAVFVGALKKYAGDRKLSTKTASMSFILNDVKGFAGVLSHPRNIAAVKNSCGASQSAPQLPANVATDDLINKGVGAVKDAATAALGSDVGGAFGQGLDVATTGLRVTLKLSEVTWNVAEKTGETALNLVVDIGGEVGKGVVEAAEAVGDFFEHGGGLW